MLYKELMQLVERVELAACFGSGTSVRRIRDCDKYIKRRVVGV